MNIATFQWREDLKLCRFLGSGNILLQGQSALFFTALRVQTRVKGQDNISFQAWILQNNNTGKMSIKQHQIDHIETIIKTTLCKNTPYILLKVSFYQ